MNKRIISIVISLSIIVTFMPVFQMTAIAAYDESTYILTGNQLEDVIGIARTQVGYHEGNNSNQLSGTYSGSGNYTKYGAEMGSNPNPWCAYFASWCAKKANCLRSAVIYADGAPSMYVAYSRPYKSSGMGTYHPVKSFTFNNRTFFSSNYKPTVENYTPKRGDYVIYEGHVGIVVGNYNASNRSFEIIDGNNRDQVRDRTEYMSTSELIGFYTPDYSNINPPVPAHTHSWSYDYDSSHPHKQYRYCSGCGTKEYTGKSQQPASCKSCFPVGNIKLTRSFDKVKGTAVFYRNNVSNAHSYSLTVYKNGSEYNTYNMSSTSKSVSGLTSGSYTAKLTAKNTNTGETKTASSSSFTIVNTYTVSYNANGGTGAPSSQTKIQDTNLTLSSTVPRMTGHIFKGWASSKTAKEAQYAAGGTYTKNAKITLYAVWEPETYVIKFDANGGKGELADTTITYGNTLRMPNSVVKDGFYLKGWSTNKSATNPDYRANMDYKLTANTQLYAVWGSSTWGGTVATEFAGGDGTEENPYQISNAGELAYLAKMVNSRTSTPEYKYYILTDNISLGYEEWMPIGIYDNENQYFKGSFDGNGFTISDLSISQPNSNQIGIFGHTTDSTIKNLTVTGDITGVSSTAEMYIGAISGYSENLNAENCIGTYINISDISTTDVTNTGRVGSLFGYAITDSVITDCKTNECFISVKSGRYTVGNIVGRLNGTIKGCEVKAENELIGATADTDYLTGGGIAGTMSGTIEECRVKAGYLSSTMRSKTYLHAGGLVGYMAANSVVKLCSVNFKGDLTRTIDNGSYPASMIAVVSGTNNTNIGGLLGVAILNTKIEDCIYNGESISATSSANVRAGGAIGYSEGSTTEKIAAQGGMPLNRGLLPKRDGYKTTWYTDSDFKNEYDFTQNVSADTTLYAKWEEGEEEQPDIWDGTTKQPSYNASTKTYTVTNGAELAWIAALVNGELELDLPIDSTMAGYTVELANDIYLNAISDWKNWSGTNAPANSWIPIGKNSTNCFKGTFNGNNHAVKGIYIYANGGADYQGLFGYLVSGTIKNLGVESSYIKGSYFNSGVYSGGIVAINSNGTISNCYNSGTVDGYNSGGIVGYTNAGTINYCYNSGKIDAENGAGGIIGYTQSGSVAYCYNTGSVTAAGAGGIADTVYNIAKLSNCYNIGDIYGKNGAGGIAAKNAYSTIEYCYNVGSISKDSSASGYSGDVVASSEGSNKSYAYLKYCYGTQSLIGTSNSYTSTTSVSQKTTAQMKSISNLAGFSTSIWANDTENTNNGYPYLSALKKYNITVIEDIDQIPINRVFANVNGIIYGQSAQTASVGGIIGRAGSSSGMDTSYTKNMLAIADRVSAVSSGNSYFAKAGDIVGDITYDTYDFSDTYAYSSMDLSAVNSATAANASTSSISSARTLAQIKRAAFLKQLFGEPYQSLEYLKDHPNAVWVQKDGELPELYFNVLNDITVSETENGTIAVDRAQAVDDEIVNVTASPAEGYELNKVYVNGKEIDGTTFAVDGDSDVFATFIEKTPEFNVEIEADENATASLTNVDEADIQLSSVGEVTLFADEPVTELTASDGEEIKVTTNADEDYTVDAIYVNGEEIAGDSFILTDDTKVTLEVTSISTDTKAITDEPVEVGSIYAVLSGSVAESSQEGIAKYIRYWISDDPETVYTTDAEDGVGEYLAEIEVIPNTTYYYQMTEFGEVKSFTTKSDAEKTTEFNSDDSSTEPTVQPTIEPTVEPIMYEYPAFEIKTPQISNGILSVDVQNNADDEATGMLIIAAYNSSDELLTVISDGIENIPKDTSKPYEIAVPEATYYRLFIWKDINSMLPLADSVTVR